MGQDERNRIEFMLGCGNNVADIAKALGRSESTISRELLNRRIDSDKHYGCSNRLCVRFDDCARTAFNGFRDIRRRDSPGCKLPHAATKGFARSYRINLRLLPELAVSSGHDV